MSQRDYSVKMWVPDNFGLYARPCCCSIIRCCRPIYHNYRGHPCVESEVAASCCHDDSYSDPCMLAVQWRFAMEIQTCFKSFGKNKLIDSGVNLFCRGRNFIGGPKRQFFSRDYNHRYKTVSLVQRTVHQTLSWAGPLRLQPLRVNLAELSPSDSDWPAQVYVLLGLIHDTKPRPCCSLRLDSLTWHSLMSEVVPFFGAFITASEVKMRAVEAAGTARDT
jgi:hypothetical protein